MDLRNQTKPQTTTEPQQNPQTQRVLPQNRRRTIRHFQPKHEPQQKTIRLQRIRTQPQHQQQLRQIQHRLLPRPHARQNQSRRVPQNRPRQPLPGTIRKKNPQKTPRTNHQQNHQRNQPVRKQKVRRLRRGPQNHHQSPARHLRHPQLQNGRPNRGLLRPRPSHVQHEMDTNGNADKEPRTQKHRRATPAQRLPQHDQVPQAKAHHRHQQTRGPQSVTNRRAPRGAPFALREAHEGAAPNRGAPAPAQSAHQQPRRRAPEVLLRDPQKGHRRPQRRAQLVPGASDRAPELHRAVEVPQVPQLAANPLPLHARLQTVRAHGAAQTRRHAQNAAEDAARQHRHPGRKKQDQKNHDVQTRQQLRRLQPQPRQHRPLQKVPRALRGPRQQVRGRHQHEPHRDEGGEVHRENHQPAPRQNLRQRPQTRRRPRRRRNRPALLPPGQPRRVLQTEPEVPGTLRRHLLPQRRDRQKRKRNLPHEKTGARTVQTSQPNRQKKLHRNRNGLRGFVRQRNFNLNIN